MKQNDKESLIAFYKRFANTVEVAETQWGLLVPTKIATGGRDKEARDKFLACTFLAGVDQKRYGKVVHELNNAFLIGQKNYPTTVENAVTMLSHHMGGKDRSAHRSDEQGKTNETSFAQKGKKKI